MEALKQVKKAIAVVEQNLKKLRKKEEEVRKSWVKKFREFVSTSLDTVDVLGEMEQRLEDRKKGSKKLKSKSKRIADIFKRFADLNKELTKERDEARNKIRQEEERLQELRIRQAELVAKVKAQQEAQDEIIAIVFELNDAVIKALEARNNYLSRHIYPHLLNDDGTLRRQITFESSDGKRKVVAMVNSITMVQPDLAERAQQLIVGFFDGFSERLEMDELTREMFDMTRDIFVEKTHFSVGQSFALFLRLEIKEEVFPELYQAQMLLRQSMRTKKTDSYIRLYEKKDSGWEQVNLR
ncbi:hypothetical protein A2300_04575 [Candidatus Falkowbacteria bacterium RIFOXYB2_FULL_35_7]|uniref:Uncharacterized protein n=1 Tax=Candidatus Falkowbacteria bacterium RIFOXYC2_FULL_36_12 TaxID=1798002 RepID=A0A1F5SW73_9BACT|nr:MAG: hypothetical protein A2300_04575 [Candidatus Falkowbacteria bacterium RIFOXYB2_FULL_35_7]OGF30960.1 MAG: hypothetical protein A2478_00760 [Candidatus Falkowbacteria bacterium RIFOXYC2_FULL_36_12]